MMEENEKISKGAGFGFMASVLVMPIEAVWLKLTIAFIIAMGAYLIYEKTSHRSEQSV